MHFETAWSMCFETFSKRKANKSVHQTNCGWRYVKLKASTVLLVLNILTSCIFHWPFKTNQLLVRPRYNVLHSICFNAYDDKSYSYQQNHCFANSLLNLMMSFMLRAKCLSFNEYWQFLASTYLLNTITIYHCSFNIVNIVVIFNWMHFVYCYVN